MWGTIAICLAPALVAPFVERLKPLLPWLMLPVGFAMVVCVYFRGILKPRFPEMLDKQNPLWERTVGCLSATIGLLGLVLGLQFHLGPASLYLAYIAFAIWGLCAFASDVRFVRKLARQENMPGDASADGTA